MVSTKKIILITINIILIILTYFTLANITDFIKISRIASVLLCINTILIFSNTKKKLTPINIIFICFILFQFGLPILYAVDNSYSNWNIEQFTNDNLVWSVKYTTICIEFFGLGILVSYGKNKNKKNKLFILSDNNSTTIYNVGKTLLLITGPIAFLLGIYVAYLASIYGYNYIKVDTMGIYNSVTRICQELIVPAFLLLIIYATNKKEKNIYIVLALIYSVILIFTGARTTSLALILIIVLLKQENNTNKMKFTSKCLTVLSIFLLLSAGTFIAQYRFYGSTETFKFSTVIQSVIEEMGFNFTSLPFTKIFVPSTKNYSYGISYIYSFICLIPRTLDPVGIIDSLHSYAPERWLADVLHIKYGKIFDYGVGYSVIAESYFNFGNIGFLSVFIQAIIINKLFNINNENKFGKYIKYIMLFSLITYPRRSFETLLKAIEYCIVLIIFLIYIFSYKKIKKRTRYEQKEI